MAVVIKEYSERYSIDSNVEDMANNYPPMRRETDLEPFVLLNIGRMQNRLIKFEMQQSQGTERHMGILFATVNG
jgi:hypothetical protein